MTEIHEVKRALISCFDKTGVVDFARALSDLGIEIVSSGGTALEIANAGIKVITVEDVTGMPIMLEHRVVTLHPKIHGGILADLDKESHMNDLATFGIEPFGIVVVNLYPFVENPGIETIDIGGPAMIRAAAKNHAHVGVITSPDQYGEVLDELKNNTNKLSDTLRAKLAREAFVTTASFDAAIVEWMCNNETKDSGDLPQNIVVALEKRSTLRYGENPHQKAAIYDHINHDHSWPQEMEIHQGKALSYINYLDVQAAWSLVNEFEDIACVVVKHANPCGVATGTDNDDAYKRAFACDDVSAFGGVVALNRELDADTAETIGGNFTEVIVAPSISKEAMDICAKKKNMRVISASKPNKVGWELKHIDGAFLSQTADDFADQIDDWKVVTERQPSEAELKEAKFAWKVCAATSSNAIVISKDGQAVGIGAGQQSRVHAAEISACKAGVRGRGGVCASDAFFPFRDGIDAAAVNGVEVVIQPGGSMRDEEVIAAANEHNIAMIFTGTRHFRH
ncbi:MAG: bifunctional phosphoribosylaminoimidazolecarboxamide formyltransferase/IMP cyclohydrolase [Acidimicrobiia bacterium]|nr:bifunctional phosphoribosylaminoimidazolecarboxamide formyltransferase/IMP cyclohydrolase [Acidimicrobiia bacterium]